MIFNMWDSNPQLLKNSIDHSQVTKNSLLNQPPINIPTKIEKSTLRDLT